MDLWGSTVNISGNPYTVGTVARDMLLTFGNIFSATPVDQEVIIN